MADGSSPVSTVVVTPPFSSVSTDGDPSSDPSLRWLCSMLIGSRSGSSDRPFAVAEHLTAQSHAFFRDLVAASGIENFDPAEAEDAARAPRIVPPARAMLGWTEEKADAEDEFAARLMAAFQSGALDVKPPSVFDHPSGMPLPSANSVEIEDARKRPQPRPSPHFRPEGQRQNYAALGTIARPLYTPW